MPSSWASRLAHASVVGHDFHVMKLSGFRFLFSRPLLLSVLRCVAVLTMLHYLSEASMLELVIVLTATAIIAIVAVAAAACC